MSSGSCLVTFGGTQVLCTASVDEDVPRWMRGSGKGWVTAEYSMLPGSSPERIRRETKGPKGRTQEIQRLIGRALRSVVDMRALGERQILIDNMPSQVGLPGFRVLTPFRREGSERLLLVDRGWVPLGATRQDLPPAFVSPEFRAVSGRLDTLPAPGVRVGDAGTAGDASWPRVLNFPRQQDLEKALGAKVESRIVLLDPAAPNGYERVWRPAMQFGPERHLGYAIQWFAFAIVALVIFIALSLRRLPNEASSPTDSTSGPP